MQICSFFFFITNNKKKLCGLSPFPDKLLFFSPTVDPRIAQHIQVSGWGWEISAEAPLAGPPAGPPRLRFYLAAVQGPRGWRLWRRVHLPTWGEAHQGAVGQRAVAVHLKVDRDGVQDGLQVLLLLQAAGRVRRRGRSCAQRDVV